MARRIVVLNDGETFTGSEGCLVVDLPDEGGLEPEEVDLKAFVKDNPERCTLIDELVDRADDVRDRSLVRAKTLLKDAITGGAFRLAVALTETLQLSAEELLEEVYKELIAAIHDE